MTRLEFLYRLRVLINPSFYTLLTSSKEELVFLNDGNKLSSYKNQKGELIIDFVVDDKTQCEATNNHIHLFKSINRAEKQYAINIGIAMAKNLLNALVRSFPSKKFVVFLSVDINDSTIVRFHQIWDNEPLYYNLTESYQKGVELFEFRA